MTRYGGQYGPDITFLGVAPCDLDDEASYAGADASIELERPAFRLRSATCTPGSPGGGTRCTRPPPTSARGAWSWSTSPRR